ncbi:hypothetical protein C8F01DRAFT_1168762 [Mycena amicta]|nr:hypothetical protein C8F01DRAFT_1176537 [Mycena amicta]KAJ7053041.1 hypothetical protein C8F01DRAFT_1168762 [Mycena amicta]
MSVHRESCPAHALLSQNPWCSLLLWRRLRMQDRPVSRAQMAGSVSRSTCWSYARLLWFTPDLGFNRNPSSLPFSFLTIFYLSEHPQSTYPASSSAGVRPQLSFLLLHCNVHPSDCGSIRTRPCSTICHGSSVELVTVSCAGASARAATKDSRDGSL